MNMNVVIFIYVIVGVVITALLIRDSYKNRKRRKNGR